MKGIVIASDREARSAYENIVRLSFQIRSVSTNKPSLCSERVSPFCISKGYQGCSCKKASYAHALSFPLTAGLEANDEIRMFFFPMEHRHLEF